MQKRLDRLELHAGPLQNRDQAYGCVCVLRLQVVHETRQLDPAAVRGSSRQLVAGTASDQAESSAGDLLSHPWPHVAHHPQGGLVVLVAGQVGHDEDGCSSSVARRNPQTLSR